MNRPEMPKYRVSQKIAGVIIAVAAALLTPLLAGFSTTVIAFTLLNALLFSMSGMIVAFFSILLDVLAFGVVFGAPGALVAMFAVALPSAIIIRNVYWRRNFGTQITHAIIAQIVGVLAALVTARLFVGSDIIGALVAQMRSLVEMLEPGVVDYILDLFFDIGDVPDTMTEAQLIGGVLDSARRAHYLDGYAATLSASLRLTLPGYLLSSACLTGILGASFSAKLMDKKLPMPGSYVRLGRWYTPWKISIGVLGIWCVAWLLAMLGIDGGDAVQIAVQQLMTLVFRVQAAASMERRLIRMNMRPAVRTVLIIAFQLLMPIEFVIYYGAFSALFGTTGASIQIQALRAKNKKDE